MRKILAKTAAVIATASLVASTIMPVFADSATNDTTGAGSTNDTSVSNLNDVKVTNVSDAYIKNVVKSTSNTGLNSASKNTMGGMIQTGDAATDVEVLNTANINTTMIDLGRDGGSNTAGNSITGADSNNWADILNKNKVNVRNDNTAVLCNAVMADSNTGGNFADKNTDGNGGMVQTGDAQTWVSLDNRANDSATAVSGLASFGSNVVGNSITGFNSTNDADIRNINDITVKNISDAAVLNMVRARANTGDNSASKNTMGGLIQSGDAGVGIEMLTDANINTTSIANVMDGSGSTSGNSVTGADSDNWADLLNRNVFVVENLNNKGKSADAPDYEDFKCFGYHCLPVAGTETTESNVDSKFHWGVVNIDMDEANTGGNWANKNTYPASIASGIAAVGKYIRVCLNDTLTSIGPLLP